MSHENFENQLAGFDRTWLDEDLCQSFATRSRSHGAAGGPLREELEACALEFNYLRGKPEGDLGGAEIGSSARCASSSPAPRSGHLEPDLVILDEFQRFKDSSTPTTKAHAWPTHIFDYPDAKVLLLSATPYKMYTLPDEPEGDDHYRDFTRTVRFLAGDERAHIVERELRACARAS